ncbi:hypothetical protein NUSPORA_00520 [Nucleospora cyclopteri]
MFQIINLFSIILGTSNNTMNYVSLEDWKFKSSNNEKITPLFCDYHKNKNTLAELYNHFFDMVDTLNGLRINYNQSFLSFQFLLKPKIPIEFIIENYRFYLIIRKTIMEEEIYEDVHFNFDTISLKINDLKEIMVGINVNICKNDVFSFNVQHKNDPFRKEQVIEYSYNLNNNFIIIRQDL